MSKIKEQIEIDRNKNLINEELDYLYTREKDLLENITDVMNLRQDLLNGIKDDLKKLADLYEVKEVKEVKEETKDIDEQDMMVGVSYDEDVKEELDTLSFSPEE